MPKLPANSHTFTKEDQIKGGKAKSPLKALKSRLNGIQSGSKQLTEEQKVFIALLKDNNFSGLIKALIESQFYTEQLDFNKKSRVADQLIKIWERLEINQIQREHLAVKVLTEIKNAGIRTEEIPN